MVTVMMINDDGDDDDAVRAGERQAVRGRRGRTFANAARSGRSARGGGRDPHENGETMFFYVLSSIRLFFFVQE